MSAKKIQGSKNITDDGENESLSSRRRKMVNPKKKSENKNSRKNSACEDELTIKIGPDSSDKETEKLSNSEEEEITIKIDLDDFNDDSCDEDELAAAEAEAAEVEEDPESQLVIDEETGKKLKDTDWKMHWGIKCCGCSEMFSSRQLFENHYLQEHNSEKVIYQCSYCNKCMEHYSTFRSHRYRHITEGRFRCEYCTKGFSVRSLLRVHVLSKHAAIKPYTCDLCGRGFGTRPGLNLHKEKHRASSATKQWPCDICGKVLLTSSGHKAHMAVHQQGKRFMCELCGKTFTQKVNMQQHFKGHSGEKPYICDVCGKGFAEKSHLNRHHSFHSDARPFDCKVCHKLYKTERCLKVHMMTHSEARPCVCSYCGKGFLSNNKLKQHYNIHTGERPYSCKFCERTFTNYPNYLKHTRRRHKVELAQLGATPASLVHLPPLTPAVPPPTPSTPAPTPQALLQEQMGELEQHMHLQQQQQQQISGVVQGSDLQSSPAPESLKLTPQDLHFLSQLPGSQPSMVLRLGGHPLSLQQQHQQSSSSPHHHQQLPMCASPQPMMVASPYIKYEPHDSLDMTPLPRDHMEIPREALEIHEAEKYELAAQSLAAAAAVYQYQDQFLC